MVGCVKMVVLFRAEYNTARICRVPTTWTDPSYNLGANVYGFQYEGPSFLGIPMPVVICFGEANPESRKKGTNN